MVGTRSETTRETPNPEVCGRCGLRRVTRDLQLQGITFRFCDECYWGVETEPAPKGETARK